MRFFAAWTFRCASEALPMELAADPRLAGIDAAWEALSAITPLWGGFLCLQKVCGVSGPTVASVHTRAVEIHCI